MYSFYCASARFIQVLEGDIGFDNAVAILNQGIQAIDSGDSVMDMQDVRKTDSAAVAVVLEWIRRAQARGAELKVINAPDSFQNLGLEIQERKVEGLSFDFSD